MLTKINRRRKAVSCTTFLFHPSSKRKIIPQPSSGKRHHVVVDRFSIHRHRRSQPYVSAWPHTRPSFAIYHLSTLATSQLMPIVRIPIPTAHPSSEAQFAMNKRQCGSVENGSKCMSLQLPTRTSTPVTSQLQVSRTGLCFGWAMIMHVFSGVSASFDKPYSSTATSFQLGLVQCEFFIFVVTWHRSTLSYMRSEGFCYIRLRANHNALTLISNSLPRKLKSKRSVA